MRSSRKLISIIVTALVLPLLLSACSSEDTNSPEAKNLAAGKAFMEQNSKKDGVITLDNGIQYKVLTEGSGKIPKLTDIVVIHSRGLHLDGTVFSDTYADGKPEEILVKHALLGWKKILPLMSVGSKWMVWLPPHMAFSNRGYEDRIAPNETLVFEMELLEIKW